MEDTPPAVDNKTQQLLTWFTSQGGWLHPSVAIEHTTANGFRLIAKEPLPANTDFVTCPLDLTLSHLNLDPDQEWVPYHDSPLKLLQGKVATNVLGYLLLIEQLVLKDKSPWHPYIDALPDQGDMTTALWRDSKYFKKTPVEHARLERLRILESEHEDALSTMAEAGLKGTEIYEICDL